MSSGDGLLMRVRAGSRALITRELRALCELARAYGNGQIELTRRANLQLRGVGQDTLAALQNALLSLGLIAPTHALEQRLSVLVSPLAGLDPSCDALLALSAALEQRLLAAELPELPSKFGIVLDAQGGALSDVFADVRVECADGHAQLYAAGAHALCACLIEDVPAAVLRVVHGYAELGSDARHDAPAWLAAGGSQQLRAQLAPWLVAAPPPAATRPPVRSFLGANRGWFGVGVPFGSAHADTFMQLADLADALGRGQVRITPWRALLIPGYRDASTLEREATRLGLICRPGDALERVDACPGAPACASALGETRALARELALTLPPGARLHVSGCSKGCAQRGPASITLVRDSGGCRVGFDLDSAQTSTGAVVPLSEARAQLSVWRERRCMAPQT